jgi:hypothetical protein
VSELKSSNQKKSTTLGFEADFANFDAFNNNSSQGFEDNAFQDGSKMTKFESDYSNKNYEKDLEQVLKRSMIEQ